MNGSGPIMPTTRIERSIVASVNAGCRANGLTRPDAIRRFSDALSCSAWISAILKCRPSSRAISRAIVATRSRCGAPPAPPQVPMTSGMPARTAAFNISRRSRRMAIGEQNGLPDAQVMRPGIDAAAVDADDVRLTVQSCVAARPPGKP